jgi:hypothetical protein
MRPHLKMSGTFYRLTVYGDDGIVDLVENQGLEAQPHFRSRACLGAAPVSSTGL